MRNKARQVLALDGLWFGTRMPVPGSGPGGDAPWSFQNQILREEKLIFCPSTRVTRNPIVKVVPVFTRKLAAGFK